MATRAVLPSVVLFGYDASPFTQKIRLALKLRQIKYAYITVPSMMPRPVLVDYFNLTYRKIPVLALEKDLYIDTSLIFEIIHTHPAFSSSAYPPLHHDPRRRVLTRLLSSHYTDRPLFRLTTGVIPQAVWETRFGTDRSKLIGHKLDAAKLGAKIPRNVAALDTYLSVVEPLFDAAQDWILGTDTPSGADISFYYQLDWADKISRGVGVRNLTGGAAPDRDADGIRLVFNERRYPNLLGWFRRMTKYMDDLPGVETRIEGADVNGVAATLDTLNVVGTTEGEVAMIGTAALNLDSLNNRIGLTIGSKVSVAPDDTGKDDPTLGTLIGLSTEEIVITPDDISGKKAKLRGVRLHFPKVGFVVKPLGSNSRTDGSETLTTSASSKL